MTYQLSIYTALWQIIALSVTWCVGVYMNSEEGDIFYFLCKLTKRWPDWAAKPVIRCINCMASLHTVIVMVLYFKLLGSALIWWQYIVVWLFAAIAASGINGLVFKLYSYLEEYVKMMQTHTTVVEEIEDNVKTYDEWQKKPL